MALRQAVVIIHGIGEQRPMDTLRGFADAMLDKPEDGRPKFWSRPDLLSESFELRKLTAIEAGARPRTDFFEYYWAYLMEGTALRHILAWFRMLLFRRPANVPPRLKGLWTLTWALLLLTAYFAASAALAGKVPTLFKEGNLWISGATSFLLALVNGVILLFIGDAARYLNPAPGNISVRHEIRKKGVELLRKLHDSGDYDRIIVVGHSLGSVVGYDILKHLWAEKNREYKAALPEDRPALKALKDAAAALGPKPSAEAVADFQRLQRELWIEQRSLGNGWRVSDFVTAGSPLSHAILLLAKDADDLRARTSERELPMCPPGTEGGPSEGITYIRDGQSHLHHAAHFAPTRWTNLYFRGDIVGGPMAALGLGVRDRRFSAPGWSAFPTSHTRYWSRAGSEVPEYVRALRDAVGLECEDWLKRVTPAGAPASR